MSETRPAWRILAVDDDLHALRIVELSLTRAGYSVMLARSAREALNLIDRHGVPHLVIADLKMPQMDGFAFVERLHAFSDVPVIMLSAISEENTVIRGIEQYAEDYITKPFSPRELVARVGRVLRRIGSFAYTLEPVVEVDRWLQVDFPKRLATVDGKAVRLTPTETKLLYLLMRSAGRVVRTDFLLRRLWPQDTPSDVRLHVHIHRLRQKIEPDRSQPIYVLSERGVGYIFAARGTLARAATDLSD